MPTHVAVDHCRTTKVTASRAKVCRVMTHLSCKHPGVVRCRQSGTCGGRGVACATRRDVHATLIPLTTGRAYARTSAHIDTHVRSRTRAPTPTLTRTFLECSASQRHAHLAATTILHAVRRGRVATASTWYARSNKQQPQARREAPPPPPAAATASPPVRRVFHHAELGGQRRSIRVPRLSACIAPRGTAPRGLRPADCLSAARLSPSSRYTPCIGISHAFQCARECASGGHSRKQAVMLSTSLRPAKRPLWFGRSNSPLCAGTPCWRARGRTRSVRRQCCRCDTHTVTIQRETCNHERCAGWHKSAVQGHTLRL